FVLEHIQNVDQALVRIENAGATVSGEKSEWGAAGIKIVGYVCTENGRLPEATKVSKVLKWKECSNVKEVRAFLGLCVYYRIWIPHFAQTAGPLYKLTKKDQPWEWGDAQIKAMDTLKNRLTTAPALKTLDYSPKAGQIILAVDASLDGWGAILMQEAEA